jgi:hypothetical protein
MPRHVSEILWEDREQREYRAAKARFFRLLAILITLLGIIAVQILSMKIHDKPAPIGTAGIRG